MPLESARPLTERELYEMKCKAASYYEKNKVPEKLEEILNSMFHEKPEDVYGRLSNFFEGLSIPASVSDVKVFKVMDSTGNSALKCQLFCKTKNQSKILSTTCLSVLPEMSLHPPPAADSEENTVSIEGVIEKTLSFANKQILNKILGMRPMEQKEVDTVLSNWINSEVAKVRASQQMTNGIEGDDVGASRTPTPSSGRKKKAPSAKPAKVKPNDKPVPPFEPLDFCLQGCSAVGLTSMAVLKAASAFLEKPVYQHLFDALQPTTSLTFPVPAMSVLCGGKPATGKLKIMKNLFLIAKPGFTMEESIQKLTQIFHQIGKILSTKGIQSKSKSATTTIVPPPPISITGSYAPNNEKLDQALDLIQEAIHALGLTAGQDIFIGIDCAAHEIFDYDKGKYEIMTGGLKSADEMVDYYRDIVGRYPTVIALIDVLRKEDREQWMKVCENLSEKCFILGSDAVYGSMHAMSTSRLEEKKASGLVLTAGGRLTITDMDNVTNVVHSKEGITMLLSPSNDVCENLFSDLGVGLNFDLVRFGAPSRGEHVDRLNRLLEIEQHLKTNSSNFKYHDSFNFPVIKAPPPPPPPAEEDGAGSIISNPSADTKSKKK